jgi:hypothetical protein
VETLETVVLVDTLVLQHLQLLYLEFQELQIPVAVAVAVLVDIVQPT